MLIRGSLVQVPLQSSFLCSKPKSNSSLTACIFVFFSFFVCNKGIFFLFVFINVEVHLRDAEKKGSDELLAQAVEAHQQCEQKSRRKQTLPKKRQCPGDDDDDAAFQPP